MGGIWHFIGYLTSELEKEISIDTNSGNISAEPATHRGFCASLRNTQGNGDIMASISLGTYILHYRGCTAFKEPSISNISSLMKRAISIPGVGTPLFIFASVDPSFQHLYPRYIHQASIRWWPLCEGLRSDDDEKKAT